MRTIALFALALIAGLVARTCELEIPRPDFSAVVLHALLGPLLFAGALQLDRAELRHERGPILALALGSTLISIALVTAGAYYLLGLSLATAAVFGALISPTDPVAVLAMLKRSPIATRIAGESLINDAVGVVAFTFAADRAGNPILLVAGAVAFGIALGWLVRYTPLAVTIVLVAGGYTLAEHLGLSAPLAAVIAGLIARPRHVAFWLHAEDYLNGVLFMLLGLEVVSIAPDPRMMLAIPVVLAARLISVVVVTRRDVKTLTLGGLRGGLAVALALAYGDAAVTSLTFGVVAFSLIVQGGYFARSGIPASTA